ncbi:MAG TPA: hypothetical protein VKS98_09620 [Chthoniobacterales bacterium]|nr:hypothetical protein [Chthoniobacterales bacterium]
MTDRFSRQLLAWCCAGVAILFCIGVALELNGSSVGVWHNLLKEPGPVRGLIFSVPRTIRVDEWGVWTPSALSQARQHPPFPIENANLGAGRSPLLMNVPVKHYTSLFRPQFYGFFVFNFARGFSFYWCAKFFGLLLAAGWALRQLGVRSRLLVIFGAVWVLFSSYVQWWFSSPAALPEMLASWFVCLGCACRFFSDRHSGKTAVALAAFIFFGINFALCVYPPYQIPLTLLLIAIVLGAWRESRQQSEPVSATRGFGLLFAGLAGIVVILVPFWFDVRSTLDLVAHTSYPGARRSNGGDLSLFKLFSGVLNFFESEEAHPAVYDNICEASNFYPLWLAAVFIILAARIGARKRVTPLLAGLLLFLFALSIYCVVPLPGWLLHLTFLNYAAERRTLLALGIANILLCCLFLDRYRSAVVPKRTAIAGALVLWLCVAVLLWCARSQDALYFSDLFHWIAPLSIAAIVLALIFWESLRYRWLPVVFGLLLIISNAPINPVMRGLSPLIDSTAFHEIDRIRGGDPGGGWVVYHTRYFAQLVKATGAVIFNGTKIVPDLELMRRIDAEAEPVYNRYANIGCEFPKSAGETKAVLVYPDYYIWSLPPDSPVLQQSGYRYILTPTEWPGAADQGFAPIEKVLPSELWIYQRKQ